MCESAQRKKKYILYGTGREAEFFLFNNLEVFKDIDYCINSDHVGVFHGLPIFKIEQICDLANKKIIVAATIWETYSEMKENLEKRGLKEFEHFVWSKVFGKKIVLVNANCHGDGIVRYLEQSKKFCDGYAVYPLPPVHINEKKEIPAVLLHNADVYLHQDIRKDNQIGYKLSDEYVLPRLKGECKCITIPNFDGMAGWMFPSLGGLDKVICTACGSEYVLYRDKVLDEAVDKKFNTLEEYRAFWLEYKYTDEELEEKWEKGADKLREREKNWDIKIVEYIMENYKVIPCFVDAHHPSKYVMREVGKQITALLELDDINDSEYESEMGIPVPVMPVVQKYFGLNFKVPREKKKKYFDKKVTEEVNDYIRAYLWWYHDLIMDVNSVENVFSADRTIISDVINRVLNCREIKDLYVFGETKGELEYLYPAIHVIDGNDWNDMTGDVSYIHISDRREFEKMAPWVLSEKETRDFILYISPDAEISGEDIEILGTPHYLDRYSNLRGTLFLEGISFQSPRELETPDEFKVLAIIHFYNEADILGKTIEYLLDQGIDLYLLDNWSDDDSYEIARRYQKAYPERVYLEQFPLSGKSGNYEWYNQLEKTEMLSKELNYDWFIHYDTDEMRVSPWENVTLREAIYHIDQLGYNCIENTVIDFRLTAWNSGNIFMEDTFFDFRHEKKMFDQVKTWKKSQKIDLKSSAGHFVHTVNPKIYPLKFLNRHYPLRSMEQAKKKVFQDRLPRFRKERGVRGWHGHYDVFKKAEDFIFDRSALLGWRINTLQELYIPFFLECGLRWDVIENLTPIELPDIENCNVILYGAGNIGRRAYLELIKRNRIVRWVDKRYDQLPAMFCEKAVSPQEILKTEYDYIVLAVKKAEMMQEIMEELVRIYDVPQERMLCVTCIKK